MKKFIERLIEMRKELNLTKYQLAEKIGVSGPCVIRWEKGERIPSAESIIALCKVLKCSADYLLGLTDD